ncbi:hypothetical protein BDQ17DRAFT_1334172 [Cyathus striatus]|nr:hypothetical protein BDQ17DRAFT_1334172 [Cyathus striatus]
MTAHTERREHKLKMRIQTKTKSASTDSIPLSVDRAHTPEEEEEDVSAQESGLWDNKIFLGDGKESSKVDPSQAPTRLNTDAAGEGGIEYEIGITRSGYSFLDLSSGAGAVPSASDELNPEKLRDFQGRASGPLGWKLGRGKLPLMMVAYQTTTVDPEKVFKHPPHTKHTAPR